MRIKTVFLIVLTSVTFLSFNSHAKTSNEDVFAKGLEYLSEGNYKKAEGNFIKSIKLYFGHYPSYYNLSYLNLKIYNIKKSLDSLANAKKFNPFDLRIDKMYSSAHLLDDNFIEAKKFISAIIYKTPEDIVSHKKLGITFLKEDNISASLSEFTLVKNLSPNDISGNILLSISHFKDNNLEKSLEKIEHIKDKISNELHFAYYAYILEQSGMIEESKAIYEKSEFDSKDNIINDVISQLTYDLISNELLVIKPIEKYEVPEVSKKIIDKVQKEEVNLAVSPQSSGEEKDKFITLPFGMNATVKETMEYYERDPTTSSPIDGVQTTTNMKFEGTTKKRGLDYSAEIEWFFNRWDNTKVDFYKTNVTKRDSYEVDIGKFSAKHFPSLVSYPTVIDGVRLWKKLKRSPDEPEIIPLEPDAEGYINLGELYRKNYAIDRYFKATEVTIAVGRTLLAIDVDERKEKNEYTLETSGQYEQYTHSYRVTTELSKAVDIGSSAAFTFSNDADAIVSSSTKSISSAAVGLDGAIKVIDEKLTFDWEIAYGNMDEDRLDKAIKHKRDKAWTMKWEYKPITELQFSYEQKNIGRNFEVEGAYQTADKLSRAFDFKYTPSSPKTWRVQSLTVSLKPEETNFTGDGADKKHYRTFQTVTDFKLPQDAKYTIDWKYYREHDKCDCTNYRTRTLKNSLDWDIPWIKTSFKPSFVFERKDDKVPSATDEKKKELIVSLENTSIKDLILKYSYETESKHYNGATTKTYHQYVQSFESKYNFTSLCDLTFKASRDLKNPSDTDKTDVVTYSAELNYTTKDRNDIFKFKYEKKNNFYKPWSDSSAYRQDYFKFEFTHKF